jgi:hypothetical protein
MPTATMTPTAPTAPASPSSPAPKPAAAPPKPSTPEISGDKPSAAAPSDGGKAPDRSFHDELGDLGKTPPAKPQGEPPAKEAPKTQPDAAKPPEAKDATATGKQTKPLAHENWEKINSELKAEREAKASLEAKIADYEARGQDSGKLTEALTAKEKEIEALKAEKAALKFEASDDFKKNYEAKYGRAADSAMALAESWNIVESADGTTPARKATRQDFVDLYHTAPADMGQKAYDMFGPINGNIILNRIYALKDLQSEANLALETEKKNWSESAKTREAKEIQERESISAELAKACKAMTDGEPDLFAPAVDDAEGNKLLQDGFAEVDTIPRTPKEQAEWSARLRMRSAAHPRLVSQRNYWRDKAAELEGIIAEMKRVGPGETAGEGGRDGQMTTPDSWDDVLQKELR